MSPNKPLSMLIDNAVETDLDFWTEQKHKDEFEQMELIEDENG